MRGWLDRVEPDLREVRDAAYGVMTRRSSRVRSPLG